MTTHISARVAWHMDGWNGHICKDPAANTYCVGCHSYPGEMIRERRDLTWEMQNAGADYAALDPTKRDSEGRPLLPPCMYSINAFGAKEIPVFADPPEWFGQGAKRRTWPIPAATVCVWPYEQMYMDEVKKQDGTLDHDRRLEYAKKYFDAIEPSRSLIFYYANYSNPLTEEDEPRYVVVGVARVKQVGQQEYFESCTPDIQQKYAGGFVWQRNVTSHYPNEGLRLPFHAYQDQPDVLEKLSLFPDNPRNFKYATRAFSDDEALNLVERFLEICGVLHEIGDTSENWPVRIAWLQSLVAELWQGRGLYPGMATVLDTLKFQEAIPYWKTQVLAGQEGTAKAALFGFLDKTIPQVPGLPLTDARAGEMRRAWQLREDAERTLLADLFPRFSLTADQIGMALSPDRAQHGLIASLEDIAANPYLLCEQFVGNGPDDVLPFYRIDHGMFPSPDLGAPFLAGVDDWRRLRGLCAEQLKRESRHTFLPAAAVIHSLNERLAFLPQWKRHQFSERYLAVDRDHLAGALTFREKGGKTYLYLKAVYDAERVIETQMRALVSRPDIALRSPVTIQHWHNYLFDSDSTLAERSPDEYEAAIQGQVQVCQRVFVRPVSVLSGSAGTGKTTVIRSLIQAVEKAHGMGTAFCLLAPTGKAADRIRSATGKDASTVHSFLALHGWLNPNMTFKVAGGRQEERFSTYIIDEASMLDLELAAALFRCIKWPTVQRLILVGDQSQLPPIGRGRLFADIMEWLETEHGDSVAILTTNVRQMENKVTGKGTGIQDLAAVYERMQTASQDTGKTAQAEYMLRRLQEGGDVDQDLRVEFWDGADDLHGKLAARIIADMEEDTGLTFNPAKPYELWTAAFGQDVKKAEYQQVLSPYRGEEMGTEHLNLKLQRKFNGNTMDRNGVSDGITLFDKVIQIRNRTVSKSLPAYDAATRGFKWVERFNGEIGFVKPHGFDGAKWQWSGFRTEHFQVTFSRKETEWVGYGKKLGKDDKGRWIKTVDVSENLELAYAVSCHKAQGSEFERVYFVVPKHKAALLSREMFYTGLTRARRHCTLLVEEDVAPLLSMYRPENSALLGINSSLFAFHPAPDALLRRRDWYAEGKIHQTLTSAMVRSKSEVIIANMLAERDVPFAYEVLLTAPDGTFYLPDFAVTWGGETYYWEHLGRLDLESYRNHWDTKKAWYDQNFPGKLLITTESATLSHDADAVIAGLLRGAPPVAAPTPQASPSPVAAPTPQATMALIPQEIAFGSPAMTPEVASVVTLGLQAPAPSVTYTATRLTFLAEKIEPLQATDLFRVITPEGTYQMSKDDFYVVFDNVAESDSYAKNGVYHYPTVPRKALPFRLGD